MFQSNESFHFYSISLNKKKPFDVLPAGDSVALFINAQDITVSE